MVNDQDFELAKDKFVADTNIISQVANGDENTVVETAAGPLRSLAKLQKDFIGDVADVEKHTNKDTENGYPSLSGFKLVLSSVAGAVKSLFASAATVARNWTLPDKDGTIALTSDIPASGVEGGYAPLDNGQRIPAVYLPSYVDDVLDVATEADLPAVGERGKIYITEDTNIQYRWSGTVYIKLVPSPGTTDAIVEGVNNLYFTGARAKNTLLGPVSDYARPAGQLGIFVQDTDTLATALGRLIRNQAFDIIGYFPGKPAANQHVLRCVVGRPFYMDDASWMNVHMNCGVKPTAAGVFTLKVIRAGGTVESIGYWGTNPALIEARFNWDDGTGGGQATWARKVQFKAGDVIVIAAPAAVDATLADLSFSIFGFRNNSYQTDFV